MPLAADSRFHDYRDFIEGLNFSDHSPVSGSFGISVPEYWEIKEEMVLRENLAKYRLNAAYLRINNV